MSAPMCDAFLVLAQSAKGLSCFLMPRWTPDGERNAIRIIRLKDKLGNGSNASSEVEFEGAFAQLVWRGGPRHSNHHRDGQLHPAGLLHRLFRTDAAGGGQAIHHARHRTAFQKKLVDQPLMENVLADLALELEAAAAADNPPRACATMRTTRRKSSAA